jgi:nitrate reductase assembly molybdenum cofactor insertion protein NarJ
MGGMGKKEIYRCFSLMFSYPDEELYEILKKLGEDEEVKKIAPSLSDLPSLEDMQVEYTGLFISAFPTLPAVPYESYYREGTLNGETTVKRLKYYNKKGFSLADSTELPDHIAIELDFIAETGDETIEKYLKEWAKEFLENVKKHGKKYSEFAKDLERFLYQDADTQ